MTGIKGGARGQLVFFGWKKNEGGSTRGLMTKDLTRKEKKGEGAWDTEVNKLGGGGKAFLRQATE